MILINCFELKELPETLFNIKYTQTIYYFKFTYTLINLKYLELTDCKNIIELPEKLINIDKIILRHCNKNIDYSNYSGKCIIYE